MTLYAKWTADAVTLANDIVFALLTDTTKTVIGMREFLLTVTYNNLTEKDSLVFIVGESAEAPAWSKVENHPAKITRTFDNAEKQTREVYFSATEKLPLDLVTIDAEGNASMTGKEIDLSQAASGQSEADYTKAQVPGIMAPNTPYYVHVYAGGAHVKTSTPITTATYPTSASAFTEQVGGPDARTSGADLGEYIWGMDAWRNENGVYQVAKDVEVRRGEVFFLPIRTRSAVDWDIYDASNKGANSYCTGSSTAVFRLLFDGLHLLATFGVGLTTDNSLRENVFTFSKSSHLFPNLLTVSEYDETFDLMYLARSIVSYRISEPCIVGLNEALHLTKFEDPTFILVAE